MSISIVIPIYLALVIANLSVLLGLDNVNPIIKSSLFAVVLLFAKYRTVDVVALKIVVMVFMVPVFMGMFSTYEYFEVNRFLRSAFSLMSIFFLLTLIFFNSDKKLILLALSFSPLVSILLGAVYEKIGVWSLWYTDFLGVSRLQGSLIPAGLGSLCYVAIISSLASFYIYQKKYFLIIFLLNFLILILTAARMPLLLSVVISISIYLSFNKINLLKVVLLSVVLGIVTVFALAYLGDGLFNRLESTSMSGRDLIWEVLWNNVLEYPWFGIGLGHQILILPEDVMISAATIAAHNEYLRMAVEMGFVGVILFMLLFAYLYYSIYATRDVKYKVFYWVGFINFLLYCGTDNAISSSVTIFSLVVTVFVCTEKRKISAS